MRYFWYISALILVHILHVINYFTIYLSWGTECFRYFSFAQSARAHISVHVLWCKRVWVSLRRIPSGRVSGLGGMYIISFSGSCQNTLFLAVYKRLFLCILTNIWDDLTFFFPTWWLRNGILWSFSVFPFSTMKGITFIIRKDKYESISLIEC